jgi:signal recognition particle receptor subunit beta
MGKFTDFNFTAKAGGSAWDDAKFQFASVMFIVFAAVFMSLLTCCLGIIFGKKKSNTIALVGICGAGKTSLFLQLKNGALNQSTVTSMDANEGRFAFASELSKNPKARPVHIVDVPGHPRLRSKVESTLPQCRGVVFVVDAADFLSQLRPCAELLFEVLTTPAIVKKRIPVLVACNKSEKAAAHNVDFMKRQLEKEIEKLIGTRSGGMGADVASKVTLKSGPDGFKFEFCSNKVTFGRISVVKGDVDPVEVFIRDLVKP